MNPVAFVVVVVVLFQLSMVTTFPVKESFGRYNFDYSAANEYVQVHYDGKRLKHPYFGSNQKLEPIWDARNGVIDREGNYQSPSLEDCGFEVVRKPIYVSDWYNFTEVRDRYLAELRNILPQAYKNRPIKGVTFWNPMLRGENFTQTRPTNSTPTAGYAALPHIDTDIGAYKDADHLIHLIEKNRMEDSSEFCRQDIVRSIKNGYSFAIVNAWRNISPIPVQRAPLAPLATKYSEVNKAFPEVAPDRKQSRWYIFSNLTREEILFFCQYDRDIRRPSDTWHCALPKWEVDKPDIPPRESLDLRMLVLFDEVVPSQYDRFSENRLRPLLSQEQSAAFCSKQGDDRRQNRL